MRHSRVRRSVMSDNIHTLGNWINHGALADGNKVAIDDRGVTISYGMLDERVNRLAQRLIDAGYRNGDRIATVAGNNRPGGVVLCLCQGGPDVSTAVLAPHRDRTGRTPCTQ